ncbi:MAG: phosphoribosyl-AMP cyclohydrolase [Puniceicoccaceae bacterium]|nr:MAG: phosphoribosyl-AMP cyclohydrolase [Puniceicoccaceae bacterium]
MPKFDEHGLIPCITVDAATNEVLMFAYMNAEALEHTLATGRGTYYSRSRRKLWKKGEESGNVQQVRELLTDCDQDVILMKVEQIGGAACHTGHRSCFFRRINDARTLGHTGRERVFDPEKVYRK